MNNSLKIIGITILSIGIIISILSWTNSRDKKLMEWSEKYDDCVLTEYGTMPYAYYEQYGEYPECNTKNYGN